MRLTRECKSLDVSSYIKGLIISVMLVAVLGLVPGLARAQTVGEGVLGWEWQGAYYKTAREACVAQWNGSGMNNGYSRFIGTKENSSWSFKSCVWTNAQYLCPQETGGGINNCGFIQPGAVSFNCASGYTRIPPGNCVKGTDLVPERQTCSYNNGGASNPAVGNPVSLLSGAKLAYATDFETQDGRFKFARTYRSNPIGRSEFASALPLGLAAGWAFDFSYELQLKSFSGSPASPYASLAVVAPDGTAYDFRLNSSGQWLPDTATGAAYAPTELKLEFIGTLPANLATIDDASSQWRLTQSDGRVWVFKTFTQPNDDLYRTGRPISRTDTDGYNWSFTYAADQGLDTITDSHGRTAQFTWHKFHVSSLPNIAGALPYPEAISQITLPDGSKLKYSYDPAPAASAPSTSVIERLVKFERLDSGNVVVDSKTYHYEDVRFPRHLTGVTDHLAVRAATYAYDARGRTVSTEGAGGHNLYTITYTETASELTRRVVNPLGKATVYRFQRFASGASDIRLVEIAGEASANCSASSGTLTYNSNRFIATKTDEEGRVTKYTRNTLGQATQIIEGFGTPVARTINITWHPSFSLPAQVAEAGLTTNYTYDTQGRLTVLSQVDTTSQTVPYSTNGQTRTSIYTYGTSGSALGKLVTIDGPLAGTGDSQTFTYNTNGYLASATDEVGKTTTVTAWDWRGAPLTTVDANSVTSTLTYDMHGQLLTTTVNPGASQSHYQFQYDVNRNLKKVILPKGGYLEYTYDGASRLTGIKNEKNETITLTPNAAGETTLSVTRNAGNTITRQQSYVYDELGRLIRTLGSASTTPTQYAYDKVDNLKTVTDGRGKVSTNAFDALNRVITATNPDNESIDYGYNAQDAVTSHADGRDLETTFVTNGFGEVIREVSPDRGERTYWYDAAGRLTKWVDGDGDETNQAFDNAGRLLSRTFTGASQENITFTYDATASGNKGNGRLTSVTEQSGATAFTYDAQGRVTKDAKTINGLSYNVQYAYDTNGSITQITLPSGRIVTYNRDNSGLVTSITTKPTAAGTASNIATSVTYDPFSGLKSLTYGNGLTLANTRNLNDWLTRIQVKDGATPKFDLGYDYYDSGQLGEIVDNAATGRTVYMNMSDAGRLTYANGPWGQASYSYDAAGNRIGSYVTVGGITTSNNEITTGDTNRLVQVQDDNGAVKRNLYYRDGGDLHEDAISGGATHTYLYGARKRLIVVQKNSVDAAYYGYDFREQRVWRRLFNGGSSTEIHYVFDQNGRLLAEHNGYSGAVLREYVWLDGKPLAVIDKTSGTAVTYYIHSGHLNEPQMMTNAAKAKVWDAYVTPFGQAKVFTTATATVDIRLPGQWYQAEAAGSGLNQNHHRDYDPSLGRYIQVDPIGLAGGQNPYAYVDGMVYDAYDPLGLDCRSENGATMCKLPGGPLFVVPTPKGFPKYLKTGGPLYHYYRVQRALGCVSPNAMLEALISKPTPGKPKPATLKGTKNNAEVLGMKNVVTSYITVDLRNGRKIEVNMTGDGSLFPHGYVVRYVQDGKAITSGEGHHFSQAPALTTQLFQDAANELLWGQQMTEYLNELKRKCGCKN